MHEPSCQSKNLGDGNLELEHRMVSFVAHGLFVVVSLLNVQDKQLRSCWEGHLTLQA